MTLRWDNNNATFYDKKKLSSSKIPSFQGFYIIQEEAERGGMSQFFAVMLRQRLYPKLPPINRRHACTRIAAPQPGSRDDGIQQPDDSHSAQTSHEVGSQ